jgi:zinc protease
MNRTAPWLLTALLLATNCTSVPHRPDAEPQSGMTVPPIAYKARTLTNGITVYSLHDPSTSNVAVAMYYEVGSKHDPDGRSGFAHLFEHLLSRKTVNMPWNMINKLVEDVGGNRNATTNIDRTRYFEVVPAQYLETMLWTHAERMARPVLDSVILDNERMAVNQEYHEFTVTPPYGQFYREVIPENTWDRVPHRRPAIGKMSDLAGASLDDARAFHEAYYGPDTGTLFVSGNFDQAQLDAWVDKYFAAIPPRPRKIPLAIQVDEPARTQPRTVTAYASNITLPAIATSWKTPGYTHPDQPVLAVLDAILTRGRNSRMYRAFLGERSLATAVWPMMSDTEEIGAYAIVVNLARGASIEEAERTLAAEIAGVRSAPVSDAELAEAKNEVIAGSLRARETYNNRSVELAEALVRSGNPRAADERLEAVQRVTAADVQRVAAKYLASEARIDFRYISEKERPAGETSMWTNPVPMPKFATLPPASRAPHVAAEEGKQQAPPAPGRAVPVQRPAVAQTTLANGLTVVTAKTGDIPLAAMTLVIKGGASDDPAGRAGLANIAAELATRGTTTRSEQQIAADIESLGATLSSSADVDGITLSISVPTAQLEAAGGILADIAQNAAFPADEFERTRQRAVERYTVSLQDPSNVASLVAQRAIYGAAPYGNVTTGTATSLQSLTRADLEKHFGESWHPANAALVIAGGIDPAAASRVAKNLFGNWRGKAAPRQPSQERAGEPLRTRTIVVDIPNAPQTAIVAAVRGVKRSDPAYFSTLVANSLLGGGTTSRIFQEVRTKRGLSYSTASFMPERMDDAALTGWAQTKSERAAELIDVMLTEFDRMTKEPFPPDALPGRKAVTIGHFDRQTETSTGFANRIAALFRQNVAPQEATRYTDAFAAVEPEQVASAVARVFARPATLVIVGDSSKFIDALRKLRPDVEVIAFRKLDLDKAM